MPSISLTNPTNITSLDFRAISTQKLGGSIQNLSRFGNLQRFIAIGHNLVGSIPDISNNSLLSLFQCSNNQLSGSIPDLSSNALMKFVYLHNNQLTGSIPDLSSNNLLKQFTCNNNLLTGSIPDLSSNTALQQFKCQNNNLTSFATGFNFNSAISIFNFSFNSITAEIPSLTGTNLTYFLCNGNTSISVASNFAVPASLLEFQSQNCNMSQSTVDDILAAFNLAGASNGVLYMGGNNASPTGGFTNPDYVALINRDWTVGIL